MGKIVKKHIGSFLLVGILIFIANTLSVLHPYIVKEVVDVDFKSDSAIYTLQKLFAMYFLTTAGKSR